MPVGLQKSELFAALLARGNGQHGFLVPAEKRYDVIQMPQILYTVAQGMLGAIAVGLGPLRYAQIRRRIGHEHCG